MSALPQPHDPGVPAGFTAPRRDPALTLVKKREHSLMSLFELSHELSVSLDLYHIADLGLLNLMGHFGTPRAALWLLHEETDRQAVLIRCHGARDDTARALGTGLIPQLVDRYTYEMEPLMLADWADQLIGPAAGLAVDHGFAVLAPVSAHGRLLGMIALGARATGEAFAELDIHYVAAAAGMVGVALENTRLYHMTLEQNHQLRDAVTRLEESDRVKSEFIRTVNHELRTPLSIIQGYASHLLDTPGIEPAQRHAYEIMIQETQKLAGMVQNLLDFSRLSGGDLPLTLELVELGDLLRTRAEARRPGVVSGLREFAFEADDPLPPVRVDAKRLHQMLDALIDNAVKFTPVGTHIRLRARRAHDGQRTWARIEVEDDGPGIMPRHLVTLFEPLRQVDGSMTRQVGGMGLGLALVKQLAEGMGGRLEVRSDVGAGTTFTLTLPAASTSGS